MNTTLDPIIVSDSPPAGGLLAPNAAANWSAASRATFWRSLQTFTVTRIVIAIVLLAYVSLNTKKIVWEIDQTLTLAACIAYPVMAIIFFAAAVNFRRRFLLQLLLQIIVDIAVISLLYVTAGGPKSGLAILYLFPLAGCAILAPLVWALFFVSVVTLILLGESGYQLVQASVDASTSQSGLYGAAFFAAVLAINRLAARLIKQEELAAKHGRDLQLQQAINRLVIADMDDGILVVSGEGAVLTANPAAERMLGIGLPDDGARLRLIEIPALMPIAEAFFAWADKARRIAETKLPQDDANAVFVVIKAGDELVLPVAAGKPEPRRELAAHLKLRFAKVQASGLTEECSVIFMQDVTEIENQAQQLKLASMGRLTASIAHEVRNPLSAISYAASLLAEEEATPPQARLLSIVGDNVARLNRMIEDILKLSRKAQPQGAPLELSVFFAQLLAEFQETRVGAADVIVMDDMDRLFVWFDPLHLREVMVNLLANAMRYASGQHGSIHIHAVQDVANRLELHVQDDGAPITPEVRAHLFEPFYTTSSKGTGLGLYLARELCLNNGAMLDYEYQTLETGAGGTRAGGRFVITLALAKPV